MNVRSAIDKFIQGYFATHDRSSKTITAYRSDLLQFARFADDCPDIAAVTPDLVERWAHELRRRDYKPASVRRKLASLRSLCNYWARREVLSSSPFWRLRLKLGSTPSLPRTLSAQDISALLRQAAKGASRYAAADRSTFGPAFLTHRDLALVELLFATGMRVGELVAIRLEDFSRVDRSILVRGKGRRERLAFLAEPRSFAVIDAYVRYRSRVAADTPALFLNARGRAASTQVVADVIRRLAQSSGISRHVTPHMLRHTAATLLLRNGADLRVVQEFLGHASITMTQRYTHVAKEHMIRTLRERHPRAILSGRRSAAA